MSVDGRQLRSVGPSNFNMSNTTSGAAQVPSGTSTPAAPTTPSSPGSPTPTTPSQKPPTTSSTPPPTTTPSSSKPPPTTSTPTPTTKSPTTSSPTPSPSSTPPTSSTPTPPSSSTPPQSTFVTSSNNGPPTTTAVEVVTSTSTAGANDASSTADPTSTPTPIDPSSSGSKGLSNGAKVAIGVVVPIVAIAVLVLVGLFFWKKRRARRHAEEERRKEVEDYSYNPNADPTIPAVGVVDNSYEMREDGSSGYRGWGTTLAGSTGRKASTTISGGVAGGAFSDMTSPTTRGNASSEPLMDSPHSPEGEILGTMGPSAANNRNGDVHRGPSNASSSYSATGRSEGSDGMGYGNGATYYDQYSQNPYSDNAAGGQPVIRDNPARRNTRIESTTHYPQQSAGISQNF